MEKLFCQLLGIDLEDNKAMVNFYIEKATLAIEKYINNDSVNIDDFENQIVDLAVYYYRNRGSIGVTSLSQGSRSMSKVDGIPKEIKETLPHYIKAY